MSIAPGNTDFNYGDMLSRAWHLYTANLGIFLGGFLLVVVLIGIGNYIIVGGVILAGPLILGLFQCALKAVRGGTPEFAETFSGFSNFLPAFLMYLVISVFSLIGTLLCVIPGLIVVILYLPAWLFLTDQYPNSFWDAMEASRRAVTADFVPWLLLFLVLFGLNLVGTLACGIGTLVTAPMSLIIITLAYEQAYGRGGQAAPPPVPPAY